MNLTQQKLEGLLTQLAMAQSKHPPSTIQIAILKAQILALKEQIEREAVWVGRIGAEHAERIIPADILNLPDHTTRLAIEDKTSVSNEQARANIEKLRLMLGNSRIGGVA